MKVAVLQDFLKRQELAGSQSPQVLEKFLLYVKLVQDPLNVFRYMEEKAICTYFPLFWYTKSEYLAMIGDYRNAFLCLKQAEERKTIAQNDENLKILSTQIKAKMYREEIFNQMRKYPPSKRRTTSQFLIMTEPFQDVYSDQDQKYETLFKLLQTKYTLIKTNKERAFQQKNQEKPKSWLYDIYKNQQIKVFEIINEALKMQLDQNSIPKSSVSKKFTPNENQERLFRSINTPFKKRDPMRMVKTLDSVQMMKRKRKSQDSKKNKLHFTFSSEQLSENLEQDDRSNDDEQQSELLINTMPVGKIFDKKKKQVKFEKQRGFASKIERPRDNNHLQNEDDSISIVRKTVRSNKGILRNKSVEKKDVKEPVFSQITQRSLKIEKTQQLI